jgi:hypothetical protein
MPLTIAVQYLEYYSPQQHTPDTVRQRLQTAFNLLPISLVLLGWNTPRPLVDACAEITARNGARLFLWHPLLCGDGVHTPLPEWRTIGLNGREVTGFQGLPEFTFVCPNKPAVHEAVLNRLYAALHGSSFQGIFLDRIRYPSPAAAPHELLACFCEACRRTASQDGLDLEAVRLSLAAWLTQPQAGRELMESLLIPRQTHSHDAHAETGLLDSLLDFRQRSITRIVLAAADLAGSLGIAVGLDCFSPCLTRMVGQDLSALNAACEWIKIMTYIHTLGPAGLPFELLGLAGWLTTHYPLSRSQALRCLAEACGLPLPASESGLRTRGLPPDAIRAEIKLGRSLGIHRLLLGTALVDLPGMNTVSTEQHAADLTACRSAQADGLVLSWDLWNISPERIKQIGTIILENNSVNE